MTAVEGHAKRRRRKELTQAIASALKVEAPPVPEGSTVGTNFLDPIIAAMGGDPGSFPNTYRKIEWALAEVGESYDATRDSSEHSATGGGTVTNTAWRKLLRGVAGVPDCFILNVANHADSADYADVPGESYGFDDDVSGREAILEAGIGSRVVFYRTGKADKPKRVFSAHAVITGVESDPVTGQHRVSLGDYQEFEQPVAFGDVAIDNWNGQHGIAEIDYPTLEALVLAGTGSSKKTASSKLVPPLPKPIPAEVDEERAATKKLASLPDVEAYLHLSGRADTVPASLPAPGLLAEEVPTPAPTGSSDEGRARRRSGARSRELDRYTEQRAVHLTKQHLAGDGWALKRDCQALGIGYDLEFEKIDRELHVEVKGIQSEVLAFNLTAYEWWRVLNDPDFVIVAVTGVLTPEKTRVHVLTRDRLASAQRVATQYRLTL